MSLYKRANSPYWWIRLSPIKGELKPLQISSGTANKRQAQQYHDKLFEMFTHTRAVRKSIIEAGQEVDAPDFGRHVAAHPEKS